MTFPLTPIQPGQRISISGRAGTGKTFWTKWAILSADRFRWVILDTKHDPEYDTWHPHEGLPSNKQLHAWWRKHPRLVIRPRPEENQPRILDLWLLELHDGFQKFGCVIDEAYAVALGPYPGPGVTGLLTRGRVRGQTVIIGAQRPALVPRFVFSEANGFCIMSLTARDDRERIVKLIGDRWADRVMQGVAPRHWLYYDVASDSLTSWGPVTIVKRPLDNIETPPVGSAPLRQQHA